MIKAHDEFDRLHNEERKYSRLHRWEETDDLDEEECPHEFFKSPLTHEPPEYPMHWTSALSEAVGKLLEAVEERRRKHAILQGLEERVQELEEKVAEFASRDSLIVPITTFAPEPFEVIREIKSVVQVSDDEFCASFFDANVNAAGCNEAEAIDNLKDLILSRFQFLEAQPPEKLGRALAKQLAVLREFVRRRA